MVDFQDLRPSFKMVKRGEGVVLSSAFQYYECFPPLVLVTTYWNFFRVQ